MPEIVLPIVHLNGTSCEELIRQRESVYDALQKVMDALRGMGPNGRDYYLEAGRMQKALDQHQRRCAHVAALIEELDIEIGELDKHRRP